MRKLLALPFLILALSATAQASSGLTWPSSPTPGVTNYVIYIATNSFTASTIHSQTFTNFSLGTNTAVSFAFTQPQSYWFAFTAVAGGVESAPSPVSTIVVPQGITNVYSVAVQAAYMLPTTNWTTIGQIYLQLKPGIQ
jgi:hypothetical protein